MASLIKLYEDNTNEQHLSQVVEVLRKGGLVVIPTDTVYAIACALDQPKAIERLAKIKGVKPNKAQFSLICYDLSNISDYTRPMNNTTFKMMKRALPGAFTFILEANSKVPKLFMSNKKTVGIRVPDNTIARKITQALGLPLVVTSVHDDDEVLEYITDPELIQEKYSHQIDLVVDGGFGNLEASTIVDCTTEPPEIIREGLGSVDLLF